MTSYANRPGYGLYETRVRDKKTGRVTVERRWMKNRVALNLNADPVAPTTWDSTGWLPDGRHRKTGTPLNPDGVPVEYDQEARRGDAAVMSDSELAANYRAGVTAAESRRQVERILEIRSRPRETPGAAMGGIPISAARDAEAEVADDSSTIKEVPVIHDGRIVMENRRVRYTDRDGAHMTDRDTRLPRWGRDGRKPVRASDLVQPDDPTHVRLPWQWAETRKVIKRMGGKWNASTKSWRLPDAEKAAELRRFLEDRAQREGVI